MYEYPPILQGTEKKQIADMRDYLIRLIRTLDDEKSEAERVAVMNKSRQTQQTAQQQTPAKPGLKIRDVLEAIFSPGSLYINANDINPKELFGFGEWVQIKDRFILAAGDTYQAGSTGGEATHTLTVNEMPSHSHLTGISTDAAMNFTAGNQSAQVLFSQTVTPTSATGGDQPHNNMPPYQTFYVWMRVS